MKQDTKRTKQLGEAIQSNLPLASVSTLMQKQHRIALATQKLREGAYLSAQQYIDYQAPLMRKSWSFYFTDADRGLCCYRAKAISIPLWVLGESMAQTRQYVLHEIAHALVCEEHGFLAAQTMAPHGKEFMSTFIRICPPHLLKYEALYKPKNLVAAGAVFCPASLADL